MGNNPSYWVPIGIAVASLIIVPALVAVGGRLLTAWREARHARLAKLFIPREELEMQWDELTKTQAKQHAQNQELLRALREEGESREKRLLGAIGESRTEVGKVHSRVDRLFELMTARKQ